MKINSIKNDFTLKTGYLESYYDSHQSKQNRNAGMCEKNINNSNIAFNGSLPAKSGAAVNSLVASTKKMKALNWLLKFVKDHNIAGSALMSLFLAGALRPVTILALPGKKDKEDKIYAAGHSMASGLIGFGISTAVTTPWDDGVKKIMDNYKNHYDTVIDNLKNNTAKEPEPLKYNFKLLKNKYEKLVELQKGALKDPVLKRDCLKYIDTLALQMKNITDWVISVPRAMLTIALIPPILKYVFGMEKKKKQEAAPDSQNKISDTTKGTMISTKMMLQKSIKEFTGGNA